MDKETLIKKLQSIDGNPDVYMYDGECGDLNTIDHFKTTGGGDKLVFSWHKTDDCMTGEGYIKLIELDI